MKYQDAIDALAAAGETSAVAVLERLRDSTRRSRSPRRPPSSRPMTPELAEEIRHLHASTTLTNSQIAARLNVNQGRISGIYPRGGVRRPTPGGAGRSATRACAA